MPEDESVRATKATTTDADADVVDDGSAADDDGAAATGRRPAAGRRLLLAQVVAVLLALGLLGWSLQGYLTASADRSDTGADARARDEVQVAANNAVEVLNTLDQRDVDAGLDAWAAVSTGDLQEELTDLSEQQRATLSEVARISEGTVVTSAVTRLDADGGSASVICFVEKQVGDTPQSMRQAPPSRIQFAVDLREEDGTWLVTTLTPVAVVTPEGEEAK